jgi:hypothetical protein
MHCRLQLGILDRWFIVNKDDDTLAWSGSRWVNHANGLPTGGVQVCNFATRRAADLYARANAFHVVDSDDDG